MALIDDAERHELYLARLTSGLLNSAVYPSLEEAYKAARAILLDAENIKSITHLQTLQERIDKQVRKAYGKGLDELTDGLTEMAVYEAGYSAQLVGQYAAATLAVPGKKQIASYIEQSLLTLTNGSRVNSGTWAQYVNGAVDSMASQYNGIIASGYNNGLTVGQMSKQIRDSTNGLLKNQADALARTGQSHYATQAREAMAKANRDIIKGRYFSSVFDNRRTLICAKYHGQTWDIDDDSYPRLPLHFGERSTYVYFTDKKDLERGTMAAVGGKDAEINPNRKLKYRGKKDKDIFSPRQIPVGIDKTQWLRGQPDWYIDSNIGVTRRKLLKDGGMKIEDFTDMMGKPINLDELRQLDAEAFKKAGL